MRFFIFVLFLISTALFIYAGHWTVSASSIILLVFFLLIWGLSEKLVLKSFKKIKNLKETFFHPIEKKVQSQLHEQGFKEVNIWSTSDNLNFQLYAFGTKKSCHIIFTESMLSELSAKEVLSITEFTAELIDNKFLSKQLLWSSIIIAINRPLRAFDALISFFSGLKTDNGEPKHLLRRLNTWLILTFRKLNRTRVSKTKMKKSAQTTLTNYSYIRFHHTYKPLKPLSVVDYALQ